MVGLRRRTARLRTVLRYLLVAFFGTAGVMHLVDPAFFYAQVPDFLPAADLVIRVTGLLFLAGAVGLLLPAARRRAALGLVVLLLVVWPGNWWGALQPGSYVQPGGPEVLDWVRVPFQLVFIALVLWATADELNAPITVEATSRLTPERVVAALTDFGPDRPRRFATLDPSSFALHAAGESWAEVTEGARPPGPVERERYDWSRPGRVRIDTISSSFFRPGSWWLYEVTATPHGSAVRLTTSRRPAGVRGWLVHAIGWFAGRRILGADLRRTLAVSEALAASDGAGRATTG